MAKLYKVVRHYVQKDNKYNIYFACTYSKMLFSTELYGSACNKHTNKRQEQQINH